MPKPDANRGALRLQLGPADADIFPGIWLHPDLVPQVLPVKAGEPDIVGRKGAPGVRTLVVRDRATDRLDLAVLLLHLVDETAEIDDMFFVQVRASRSIEGKNVVSGSRRNLSRGARRYLQMRDVINGYGDAVLLAPLRCKTIEPFIVLRHEMAPLEDL